MKQHILPAIRLTLVCIIVFVGIYSLLILGIAQAAPNKGGGEIVTVNGKTKGFALEGQNFTQDKYFNDRPSAAGYNATGSSGSNKGTTNPDYLKDVQKRIDTFLVHNPTIKKEEIPSDLVTASGSGLDPDISIEAAYVQVNRIASLRKIPKEEIRSLIDEIKEQPLLNSLGTAHINVLKLNIALDNLK
jgi:K+-transporting ATPase ATPase C chain